jgi:hypothetical protein
MGKNYLRVILSIIAPVLIIGTVYVKSSPDDLKIFMNGKLSNQHSYLENDCKSCHIPWNGLNNESCTSCHYDDEHYLNEELSETIKPPVKDMRCYDCHREHQGRLHNITEIEDTF